MKTKYLIVIFILFAFSASIRFIHDRVPWWEDNDFAHYFASSYLASRGIDPYLPASVHQIPADLNFHTTYEIKQLTNPPALILLTMPLILLSPKVSFFIWSGVQLLSFLSIIGILLWALEGRSFLLSKTRLLLMILTALVSAPMYIHLKYGQTQLLVCALSLCTLLFFKQKKDIIGNFLLGISVSLKLFTWPLIFFSWKISRWKGVFSFLAGLFVPFIVFAGWLGRGVITDFFHFALPFVRDSAIAYTGNISLPSALHRTLSFLDVFSENINSELVSLSYLVLLVAQIIAGGFLMSRKDKSSYSSLELVTLLSWCLLISSAGSLTCWPHYLVLVIPSIFVLVIFYSTRLQTQKLFFINVLTICLGVTIGAIPHSKDETLIISTWWGFIFQFVLVWLAVRHLKQTENSQVT